MPRQSFQPTIAEKLNPIQRLNAVVQPRGMYEYTEAKASPVGFNRLAGSGIYDLAGRLRDLSPALDRAYSAALERWTAEDWYEAEKFVRENPEATKNQQAWAAYSKDHPEVLNKSPWVRKDIENLILRNTALEIQTQLNDHYVTSGLVNERDQAKVNAALSEKQAELIKASGVTEAGHDTISYGAHFLTPLHNSISHLMAKHTQDVESQNAELLGQQYAQEALSLMKNAANPVTSGNRSIDTPEGKEAVANTGSAALMEMIDRMTRDGFPRSKIVPFLLNASLKSGLPSSVIERLGNKVVMTAVDGKTQITLAQQPGFKLALDKLKEEETDRGWKAEVRAHTRQGWAREEADRNALQAGFEYGSQNGDISLEAYRQTNLPLENYHRWAEAAKYAHAAQLMTNPENAVKTAEFMYDLKTGKLGISDVFDSIANGNLTPEQAKEAYGIAAENTKGGESADVAFNDSFMTRFLTMASGFSIEELDLARQGKSDKITGVEAAKLREEAIGYQAELDELRKKRKEELGVEQLPVTEQQRLMNQLLKEKTTGRLSLKEQKAQTRQLEQSASALASSMTDTSTLVYNDPDAIEDEIISGTHDEYLSGSLKYLNTIIPSSINLSDIANPQLYRQLKRNTLGKLEFETPMDVIAYAKAVKGNTLTWRDYFSLAYKGENPEKYGITSPDAAMLFLDEERRKMSKK